MINDFTFLYGNNKKVSDAFGPLSGEMMLGSAKRIFGGREKVFFEYGKDESFPYAEGMPPKINKYEEHSGLLLSSNGNAAIGLDVAPILFTGSAAYQVEYRHGYVKPQLLGRINTYETKKYYSIDLSYILSISRAFTTYDFSSFDGEGLRILKAWIFIMTYGTRDPEDYNNILLQSSKNEYGDPVRNRVFIRNTNYDGNEAYTRQGSAYAGAIDSEWSLSADDYSRIASLDLIFTQLSKGSPLYHNGTSVPDLIHGTRQYADLVPEYLTKILNLENAVNDEQYKTTTKDNKCT